MTGKEKFNLAIKHEEGPLLFDLGGMPTTGMHCRVMEELRDFYGLEKRPVKILEPAQMLGMMEDDLRECLGVETTPVWSSGTALGFSSTGKMKEWKAPWGQNVLMPEAFVAEYDKAGNLLAYAGSDKNYPPSMKMPKGGMFFDNIERGDEFDETDYNIEDNLEEWQPYREDDLNWFRKQMDDLRGTDQVVLCNPGAGTALGDPSMVPGPMLKMPKGIRRITDWYMATAVNQEIVREIFDRESDIGIANLKILYETVGNDIQVIYICGTDFGTQRGPFYSKEVFEQVFAPYYKKINNWIHENTNWKTFKHTCGGIEPLLDNLIEAGFDCINPVQWNAGGMERNLIKEKYGDRLVYWGGGIDTQHMLPEGSPEQVYEQALECCRIFGKGGGYVFNTVHNIVPGVPAANVDALARAVRKYNNG